MCEDNIEYDNDLKNEDYLKYEEGQPKIWIQSHIWKLPQSLRWPKISRQPINTTSNTKQPQIWGQPEI